jgi:predicted DNA binding protein
MGKVEEHNFCVKVLIRFFLKTCPLAKISVKHYNLEYRIQEKQVLPKGGVLASLLVKETRDTDSFFRSLNASEKVRSLSFLYFGRHDSKIRIDFDCTSCMFLQLTEDMRVSSDHISYKNGSMEAAFTLKDYEEFRRLLKYFKKKGVGFEVLEVKRAVNPVEIEDIHDLSFTASSNLTPKQLEILKHAYRSGYFDRDRKVNLGDIAKHFGLSSATVGVHMRVGLKKILKNMI